MQPILLHICLLFVIFNYFFNGIYLYVHILLCMYSIFYGFFKFSL